MLECLNIMLFKSRKNNDLMVEREPDTLTNQPCKLYNWLYIYL